MQYCLKCNYLFPPKEISDGCCKDCLAPDLVKKHQKKLKKEQELREIQLEKYNAITLTTEITAKENIERIEIISSECIYGINKKKHLLSSIIDLLIGKIEPSKNSLKYAENKVMDDFKEQAFLLGGDAVIAIKTEHIYTNAENINMSVVATGTVVKLKV